MTVKESVKALIPNVILAKLRVVRAQWKAKKSKNLNVLDVFSEIYQKGLWGKSENSEQPYYSGSGSHDQNVTEVYLESVKVFLKTLPNLPNVVDLGCGDFNIGSQLRQYCNGYVACDIVPQLIAYNKDKYKNLKVDFRTLNLITDPLPTGDIVFIRQVLQHLSNEQVQKLIPKLYQNYTYLILTEHLPKSSDFPINLDKPVGPGIRLGYNSGIVITKNPFNLKYLHEQFICDAEEGNGVIRTILYKLK